MQFKVAKKVVFAIEKTFNYNIKFYFNSNPPSPDCNGIPYARGCCFSRYKRATARSSFYAVEKQGLSIRMKGKAGIAPVLQRGFKKGCSGYFWFL